MKILIRTSGTTAWVEVGSASYEAEADLQQLIADSPSIIPVEEITGEDSPYVLSVKEFALPGSGNTDLLLFSPVGKIGIIECKLAANPEIKRKVIGQILEYGAFLWGQTYEYLDSKITQATDKTLAEKMSSLTNQEQWDEESFRSGIQDTLERGSFNLIIAVDHINEELQRTIDYLNECGSAVFSFHALELHKYKSDETEMLVPHMYGKVPQAKRQTLIERRLWSEEGFLEHARENVSQDVLRLIVDLLKWTKENAHKVFWGRGKTYGSFTFHFKRNDRTISVFTVTSLGYLYLNYGYLSGQISKEQLEGFHSTMSSGTAFQNILLNPKAFPAVNLKELSGENDESLGILRKATLEINR